MHIFFPPALSSPLSSQRKVQNYSDQEISLYYVANDIAETYWGMMIAIPEAEWRVFSLMRLPEMVGILKALPSRSA